MKLAEYYKILHCLPSCTGNEAKLKQGEYTSTVLVTRERTGIRQTWVKVRGRREKGERERERESSFSSREKENEDSPFQANLMEY